MLEQRQALSSRLAAARQQLREAAQLVAHLEAQLAEDDSQFTILSSDVIDDLYPLDNLLEGCQIIGFDWRYRYINDTAARHGQKTKQELLGRTMMACYPGIENTEMFAVLQRCMQDRTAAHIENQFVYADGTSAWFELSIQPVPEGIFILSLDITERKQNEAALKRYAQRLEILHNIDTGIIQSFSIEAIIQTALKNIWQIIPCRQASVVLFDATPLNATVFWVDSNTPAVIKKSSHENIPLSVFEDVNTGKPVVIDDARHHPQYHCISEILNAETMCAFLHMPLMMQNQAIGVFVLCADSIGFFTTEYQEIAVQIASQLTVAISQIRLFEEIQQRTEIVGEMQQFLQTTFDALPANTAVLAPDGTIISVNHAWKQFAEANAAHTANHFLGENYLTICDQAVGINSEGVLETAAGIRAVIAGEQADFHWEYPCHSPDEKRWFMLRVTPFAEPVPRRVVVAHINITERWLAENELAAVYDATSHLFAADTLLKLGQQIVDTVVRTFNQADCGLMLVEKDGKHITCLVRAGIYHVLPELSLKLDGQGLVPLAIRTGDMVYAPDVTHNDSYLPSEKRTRSELVIPLKTAKGVIGVLDLQDMRVDAFGESDRRILKAYAERAAAAIENMQLYEAINQYASELEERVMQRTSALNQAKEQVEAILDNSPDGIVLISRDLIIQMASPAFMRLVRCQTETCVNHSLLDFCHPEDTDTLIQMIQTAAAAEQKRQFIEIRAARKDAAFFDMGISVSAIKNDGLVCVIHDITRRKAQERLLRYHASLQENVTDAVIVTDMAFRIQSWNQAAERIYGWRADEVIGQQIREILQTEYASPEDLQHNIQQLQEQGWWHGEVIQHHKDGTPRYILGSVTITKDEHGTPFSIVAVNHDITEHKRAEENLQKSAAEIHDLYNNAPCGYHSLDKDGIFIQINDTELRWLGYTRDEVIGKCKFTDFITPESILTFQHNFPLFKQRGWVNDLEFDLIRKDGSILRILLNSIAVYDDAGQYVQSRSTLFDITELYQTRLAQLENQERLKALHEITIALTQIDNLDTFYRRVVEFGLELLGFERMALFLYDEQTGMALGTYGTDTQGQIVDEKHVQFVPHPDGAMHRALTQNQRFHFDEHIPLATALKPSGTGWNAAAILWDKSQILGWLVADNYLRHTPVSQSLLDILGLYALTVGTLLAQKHIRITLQESEEKFRRLVEAAPVCIIISNADGHITLINNQAEHLFGYTRQELVGQAIETLTPNEIRGRHHQHRANYLAAPRLRPMGSGLELLAQRKDGTRFPVEIELGYIQTPDGILVMSFVVDITERKMAEKTLRQALAKEKELNELKSRFVSMASHEFRTPVAAILALTESVSAYRHRLPEDQIEQKLNKIKAQVGHLKSIMEDVLLLARLQARRGEYNPVRVNPDALCRSVLDEFLSDERLRHRLHYVCDVHINDVLLDRKLMRQMMNNLVSNAIKYSPADKSVYIHLTISDESLVFEVRDEGIGIPETDLTYLFEPFHRAANVGTIKGTGLGLVITKESVELHGGSITVQSQENVGTTFTIRIPISTQEDSGNDENSGD